MDQAAQAGSRADIQARSEPPPGVVQTKTQTQILYELFPYDWNYTDDMSQYANDYYDEFESEFITEDMAAQNRRVARNLVI